MWGFLITLILFGLGVCFISWSLMSEGTGYSDLEGQAFVQGVGILFVILAFVFAFFYSLISLIF